MTILERLRGERRRVQFGRIAKDLMNRDITALGRDAAGVLDQVKDIRAAAADAIEHFQAMASDAADRAGDALDHVGDEAAKATRDISLDGVRSTGDDLAEKLRKALPTDRITRLVENLERELPTTDKGRYDRAYGRGWARARTSFIVIGAATGIAAGIAGAFLLDPTEGPRRREALRGRLRGATQDITGAVSRTASVATDRARALGADRGVVKPDADLGPSAAPGRDAAGRFAPAVAPRIPVMDVPDGSPTGFDMDLVAALDAAGQDPSAGDEASALADGGLTDVDVTDGIAAAPDALGGGNGHSGEDVAAEQAMAGDETEREAGHPAT